MESNEGKFVKISFESFVLILIALITIVFGLVWFYTNNSQINKEISKTDSQEKSYTSVDKVQEDIENNIVEEKQKIKLGKYLFEKDGEYRNLKSWLYSVELNENNKVRINFSNGVYFEGEYEITDDVIVCRVPKILFHEGFYLRYNEKDVTNEKDVIKFDILGNNKIGYSSSSIKDYSKLEIKNNFYILQEEKNDYKEIKKELMGLDRLYVTEVKKNGNKYTLMGRIYSDYRVTRKELDKMLQNGYCYIHGEKYNIKEDEKTNNYILTSNKDSLNLNGLIREINFNEYSFSLNSCPGNNIFDLTDNYMQITVDGDIHVSKTYGENDTVKTEFDNFKKKEVVENYNPEGMYYFSFENGKCVEVITDSEHY